MRLNLCLTALIGVLGLATVGRTPAVEPEKTDARKVADLIEQLGHDKFAKREAASKELKALGEPALAALQKAASSDKDPEIRLRAGRIVEAIEDDLPFFNGRGLTGWQGLSEYWSVKDGELVGTTQPHGSKHNTFLCSKRAVRDFELKFKVRMIGVGWPTNSGVQIRSQIADQATFTVQGHQCDIGKGYWGDLHGELLQGVIRKAPQNSVAKAVKEQEFNDYYIRCVGKHVTIKINDVTMVDDDIADMPESGIIAWQLHRGEPMTVRFKDIEFKDLSRK